MHVAQNGDHFRVTVVGTKFTFLKDHLIDSDQCSLGDFWMSRIQEVLKGGDKPESFQTLDELHFLVFEIGE
jgi:hypothetical protein